VTKPGIVTCVIETAECLLDLSVQALDRLVDKTIERVVAG
jgi:hypothetical protein